jgi:hypothetical protein
VWLINALEAQSHTQDRIDRFSVLERCSEGQAPEQRDRAILATSNLQAADGQSKLGKAGLWRSWSA